MLTRRISRERIRQRAAQWVLEGVSPQRLALTLSLGFVLGCIPMVGIPTALCAMIALIFRLNVAAMQAANYLAMPFQLALVFPLVRLGGRLFPYRSGVSPEVLAHAPSLALMHSSTQLLAQFGLLAGQALLGWLMLAIPLAAVLTVALTSVLRRVPALAPARAE